MKAELPFSEGELCLHLLREIQLGQVEPGPCQVLFAVADLLADVQNEVIH
jgi:hypothetical protein